MQPKVSVIIPVYKVESYIERCAHTLFNQTLKEIEYVFIDDNSPDSSIVILNSIIEQYPHRKHQVKIISHEQNEGVGQSRKDGVDAATGEYIIHCDPDDWVDRDYYEKLYNAGNSYNSDVVISDYFEETENQSNLIVVNIPASKTQLFHEIVTSNFHMGLWNKLIISSLAKELDFKNGLDLWEDINAMTQLLLKNVNLYHLGNTFYHYKKDNINSYVNMNSPKNALSQIYAVKEITNYIAHNNLSGLINYKDLLYLQWRAKRKLLMIPDKSFFDLWRSTFSNVNDKFQVLNISTYSKLLTFLVVNKLDALLKLLIILNNKRLKYLRK